MKNYSYLAVLGALLAPAAVAAGNPSMAELRKNPDAMEVVPGVFEVATSDSTIRTYAFGVEGMRHDLEWMREAIEEERGSGRQGETSELERLYRSLSGEYFTEGHRVRPTAKAEGSGYLCAWVKYDLYATANSGPFAFGKASFEIASLAGPLPPFFPESVRLYTGASVVPAAGDPSDTTHEVGPVTYLPIGTSRASTSHASGSGPNTNDYATAFAAIQVVGESCPGASWDNYRSVQERFIQW